MKGDTRSLGYSSYHGNLASLSSTPAFELWVKDLKLGALGLGFLGGFEG